MAFRGKFPIRTEVLIDNELIEQLSHFTYLGCNFTYSTNKGITRKLNEFKHISGTLKRTLKNKTQEETQIRFHKMMAVPTLL
jgi:hypothetical protein